MYIESKLSVPTPFPAICGHPKERGTCADYSIKWYYDVAYGDCTRFWYGGCEGNGNIFEDKDACRAQCVSPPGLRKYGEKYVWEADQCEILFTIQVS